MTETEPAPTTSPEFHARCRELVALKKEEDVIDERLAIIKKRRGELEAFLLEAFATTGQQNMRIDGRTVYLHRSLWAGADDKQAAHDALIKAGLTEYATRGFNTNSVSALYREWERDGTAPPPELEGVIKTGERYSVRVTK